MARIIAVIGGMLVTFGAVAHPYHGAPPEAPLAFIEHRTDDDRPIFTNVPKSCFTQGRLTCIQLHPVFRGRGTIKKPLEQPGT